MNMQFTISKKLKKVVFGAMLGGFIFALIGLLYTSKPDIHRIWANVLLNGFLITGIALGGAFFVVVHIVAESGWHTTVQRIAEAMGSKIWLGAILLSPILLGSHYIYHWSHTESLDHVLKLKQPFLNLPFFALRMIVYLAGWILLFHKIRHISLLSDSNPDISLFKRLRTYSGIFIVFFAITSSASAWDWLMSIDAHWFSTLYGWYTFIGIFVTSIAILILLLISLQKLGYMQHVNNEHLHDLGKYLFAFSIFWAYLWISQYLLIWYGNIPEETGYFVVRVHEFGILFYINIIGCFVVPFFALMSRGNKRHTDWLMWTSIIVVIGHWIDLYLAIMPGAVGYEKAGVGLFEIGMTILYLSIFFWFVFKGLGKGNLVPENHPYYKESFDYENIK